MMNEQDDQDNNNIIDDNTDHYISHWYTRFQNREVHPLIKRKRTAMMKKMDLPSWFSNNKDFDRRKRRRKHR